MVLVITDFRMAGFLVSRNIKFLGTELRGTQVAFIFDDTASVATKTLTEYPNSVEQRYDSACKTMHDMVKIALSNKK
jgi:hypothetical protein